MGFSLGGARQTVTIITLTKDTVFPGCLATRTPNTPVLPAMISSAYGIDIDCELVDPIIR